MAQNVNIIPKDTIIARDGRPFSKGGRMKSLNWFYPSVVAGTIRTAIGYQQGFDFKDKNKLEELKNISIKGPLPIFNNMLYFPAPLDCVLKSRTEKPFIARPIKNLEKDEWTNLPEGLIPVTIDSDEDFKPCSNPPAFWSKDIMIKWLFEDKEIIEYKNFVPFNSKSANSDEKPNKNFISFPQKDIRTNIQINNEQTTKEGMLFQTTGLDFTNCNDFSERILLSAKIDDEQYTIKKSLATMGGESRTVGIFPVQNNNWDCPQIEDDFDVKYIRMVLATPAIFKNGWKPGWLNEGNPPIKDVKLKLKSAIIDRWQPISGWDLEKKCPKPVRRMVPAGSVYFFEVEGNVKARELSKLWLKSVCDEEQNNKDGFGLALFGIYNKNI